MMQIPISSGVAGTFSLVFISNFNSFFYIHSRFEFDAIEDR